MKNDKFHIYLDDDEYRQVVQCLISLKNALIEQGRYTDAVDEVLIKFTKARKKKIAVQYLSLIHILLHSSFITPWTASWWEDMWEIMRWRRWEAPARS